MSDDPRLPDLFAQAAELGGAERAAWLARLRTDEPALAREVEQLLAAADEHGARLDTPAAEQLPAGIDAGIATAPDRIGPYFVVREIGRGGMGRVYLAEQQVEGVRRPVALKVLDRPGPADGAVRRFRDEVRILASLDHPGIARFLDGGRADDGTWYLALEYVEGVDLVEHARRLELAVGERIRLFLAVLEAVAYAHARGVVHRDLKPGNILVARDGRPRLLDFGISRLVDPEAGEAPALTLTDARALTPAYASPEQFRGERATAASDVYSLGVVLYELLAGQRPFGDAASSRSALERAVLESEPEPPSTAARRTASPAPGAPRATRRRRPRPRRLSGDLDAVCLKALRKNPGERYGSATALAADLERFLAGRPVEARRGGRRYRLARFAHRHRGRLGIAAVAALALAAIVFAVLAQSRVARIERRLNPPLPRATALAPPPGVSIADLERRFAQAPESLDAGAALAWALLRGSRAAEARVVVGRLRQLPAAAADPVVDLIEATAATALDEPQRALALADQALAHARAAGRDDLLGRIRSGRARSLSDLGQRDEARAELERAHQDAARTGDQVTLARVLNDLAIEELQRGEVARGEGLLEQALAAARTAGDRLRQGTILHNLAGVASLRGRPDLAEPRLREAAELFRELDSPRRLATSLGDLALAVEALGRTGEVEALRDEALVGLRAAGDDSTLAHVLCQRGAFDLDCARLDRIEATAREIEAAAEASGTRTDLALAELLRGRAAAVRGDSAAARRALGEALRLFHDAGEGDLEAEAGLELAAAELAAGRPVEAARLAEAAAAAFRNDRDNEYTFGAEMLLARVDLDAGRLAEAGRRLAALGAGADRRPVAAQRIAFRAARAALARAQGRHASARSDLESALADARTSRRRLDELDLRLALAELDGDAAGAAAVAAEAGPLGLAGLDSRARALGRELARALR